MDEDDINDVPSPKRQSKFTINILITHNFCLIEKSRDKEFEKLNAENRKYQKEIAIVKSI